MPSQPKDLNDLFHETLKDIYFAEKQILRALPKMAHKANGEQLAQAFEQHRTETEGQIERLEKVFEMIGKNPRGKTCDAIMGIIDESKEVMEDFANSDALDAGILAAAQAVEHYEISRYGTLIAWAEQLGLSDAVPLLEETLAEERRTDVLLSKLALASINVKAAA
ncbi:ferritin-like domain-containing protein [Niveispirillum sp. KHB5.9]|uniref:YciE/YciF ferroxidase family protein n=1 Tax=Niveispirillum sp. KHB5.9 TaxID=3400269 RepID=UPI003A8ABF3A